MNSVTAMIKYYKKNYSKDKAVSKVHNGGLTPGYQKVIIGILSVEDLSATCLLLKNQTPERQYFILKEKIQSLFEEAAEMSIRFNQTPLSQTSLITIPSSVAPSIPVIPLAPIAKEEALQSKVSKLENDVQKQKKRKKKTIREKESLGLMSPGIKDPDTKGLEISPGIKNQEMLLPDRVGISPGIKD